MAKNSLNPDSVSRRKKVKARQLHEIIQPEDDIPPGKTYYFNNALVERLLGRYVEGACVDVKLRDEVMSHASELIRQIIRANNLHMIYPGRDDSSFFDLFQLAWCQIESTLYKYQASPHCLGCYDKNRPSDSSLADDFVFLEDLVKLHKNCPRCEIRLIRETVYYRGRSKVFNMWCIAPDSLLISDKGVRSIGNIVGQKSLDSQEVYGLCGMRGINASINKPRQKAYRVKTRLGYEIIASAEHRFYSLQQEPIWKIVKWLRCGDLLGIQYDQQQFIGCDDLSKISLSSKGKSSWQLSEIDEELAYILGIFIAEGSFSRNQINIYNTSQCVIDKLVNNSLGLRFKNYQKTGAIVLCDLRFSDLLSQLGFNNVKAHQKFIPQRLLGLSRASTVSLLRGMFDGDGHSSRHNGCVGYTSTSKRLIDQIRMILLNMGMLSKISSSHRDSRSFTRRSETYDSENLKTCYQLQLSTLYSRKFYSEIGFGISYKQEKKKHLKKPKEMLYGLNDGFRNLHRKYGPGTLGYNQIRRVLKASSCTLSTAKQKLMSWKDYAHDEDYRFIADRIKELTCSRDKTIWLPIISINETESELCEISVDSDDHSYIANGFISHNSQVARTVTLAHIKRESRDRKNYGKYQTHLIKSINPRSYVMDRFLLELKETFKHSDDHLEMIDAIDRLYGKDDKAHEGFISKLVMESGKTRPQVASFLKVIRLRSFEFTDSPMTEPEEKIRTADMLKKQPHEDE